MFPDEGACVNTIAANLEGEVAEWMTVLHNKGAPELGNISTFIEELRARFGDPTQACWVEQVHG
ncbi:Cbp53E: Calbindin-32 [Crotalus adamanteus]|uniref:Cbp53E: Calbindin-32 n=1 Tax=Crotalus adamanteus TaxID=8729 RepID=A0AAW1BPS8_CROAD